MELNVHPLSMVDREGRQKIALEANSPRAMHCVLKALDAETGAELCASSFAVSAGESACSVLLPAPKEDRAVRWVCIDESGQTVFSHEGVWKRPREWTFYVMISSHTDIGLHNPPYVQRYNSASAVDAAMKLCDETQGRKEADRFRYVLEGTWVFDCHAGEHGEECARRLVRDYVHAGSIGVCVSLAGNHTQTFGLEETARAACERKRLRDEWDIDCKTLAMIDVNGMSWGMVQPFSDAGYENVIFSPNHWNPHISTVWQMDHTLPGAELNPEAGGGGSRMDMRWGSSLPRVFYWQSAHGGKPLLVWSGGMYSQGGVIFGFSYDTYPDGYALRRMEAHFAKQLPRMEAAVPYDLWLLPCYGDDEVPNLRLTDLIALWNEKWRWPRLRTLGDPDEPFRLLRDRFGDLIPTLRGDITGGWYQHPVAAPELLAKKTEADRLLPAAEKLCSFASLVSADFRYPSLRIDRAWKALLCNDEHSYGTSGYQGRRVYETWMQHRDWIDTALCTAKDESEKALQAISAVIHTDGPCVVAFNTTAREMHTDVEYMDRICPDAVLTPMGYTVLSLDKFVPNTKQRIECCEPPVIENKYYRVRFSENGGLASVFDKALGRELVSQNAAFPANCFVWTQDGHKSFAVPGRARFEVLTSPLGTEVFAHAEEVLSGAAVLQRVSLRRGERLIRIENTFSHVRGLYNDARYFRYAYQAFPFEVPSARRICALNGCEAEYAKDVTGHGTDVYMAAHEWVCAENGDFGVGVIQWDSELVEFDHIHPDKTDFGLPGEGSAMYFYLANDWLQMHSAGGSHMNFRFRYAVTSYEGDHVRAGLPEFAEELLNPPLTAFVGRQNGRLAGDSLSLLNAFARVLTVKPAPDSDALIVRLYGRELRLPEWNEALLGKTEASFCTVDGRARESLPESGFGTLLLRSERFALRPFAPETDTENSETVPVIGSAYTGLIQRPCAARGEKDGMLYLLWGAPKEKDLKGYELFRGEEEGFEANEASLIAFVKPEEYCVGRYVDEGLKHHSRYFYRVRAVDAAGRRGPLSSVFGAWTKE